MSTLIFITFCALLTVTQGMAQCLAPTDTFEIMVHPSTIESGQTVYVSAGNVSEWPSAAASRFRAALDGTPVNILSKTTEGLVIQIPTTVSEGTRTLSLCVVDGPYAETTVELLRLADTLDTAVDRFDPDPRTQNGPRQDLSSGSRRPQKHGARTYPNGGYGGTQACSDRHHVDGKFTEYTNQPREWSGIPPMIGRFSNLYLDYCSETSMMYLMNDWLIGSSEYQANCYNLFGFVTGNGREVWLIKVTHDTLNPVIVELNGVDVTNDTNLVIGGAFSIGPSPSDTTAHTMYEFGVRVSSGLFFMPQGDDPVTYVPSTNTSLECDRGGVQGYGLIREPFVRIAWFSDQGITVQQAERYIPTSGVLGLETEPNNISGEFGGDTIEYRSGSQSTVRTTCNGILEVDGQFSDNEWTGVRAASGRYSDMYAKYCQGTLHILNDWVHATELPDQRTCYNLFELYTGNGSEHWGIWVWQDPERRPTVYRNGVDVSNDTLIVHAGKAGWGSSPRKAEPHALYEFTISAMEGGFVMMFADPGPSSFCSASTSNVGNTSIKADERPFLYPNQTAPGGDIWITGLSNGDRVQLIDLLGCPIVPEQFANGSDISVHVPFSVAIGRYTVCITRDHRVFSIPVFVSK